MENTANTLNKTHITVWIKTYDDSECKLALPITEDTWTCVNTVCKEVLDYCKSLNIQPDESLSIEALWNGSPDKETETDRRLGFCIENCLSRIERISRLRMNGYEYGICGPSIEETWTMLRDYSKMW